MDIEPRLGVDFGRVIHGARSRRAATTRRSSTGTFEEALASPATAGVYEVLPGLIEAFGGRAWIISKCGDRVRERTLAWLDHHDFYARTGLPRGNVRFCYERAEKAVHCRELGITHMIDDRLDVHRAIRGIVPHLYLFGPAGAPEWVRHVPDWAAAEVDPRRYSGGTRPVSHTPLSLTRNSCPSAAIRPASTTRTTGFAAPRADPPCRLAVGGQVDGVASMGRSPSRRIGSTERRTVPWKRRSGGGTGGRSRSTGDRVALDGADPVAVEDVPLLAVDRDDVLEFGAGDREPVAGAGGEQFGDADPASAVEDEPDPLGAVAQVQGEVLGDPHRAPLVHGHASGPAR